MFRPAGIKRKTENVKKKYIQIIDSYIKLQNYPIYNLTNFHNKTNISHFTTMSNLYQLGTETKNRISKFRISTGRAETIKGLSIKIEPKTYEIVIDEDEQEELDDMTELNELAEIMPDNSPRFLLLAYPMTNKDGIKQTPLVLIYWKPSTVVSQEWKMMYAGALEMVRNECGTYKLVEVSSGLEDDDDVEELIEQIEKTK